MLIFNPDNQIEARMGAAVARQKGYGKIATNKTPLSGDTLGALTESGDVHIIL
jgi:hypothetical protein